MTESTEKRKIAVTGAAGYLGRHLVRWLLAQPSIKQIVALDCRPLSDRVFFKPRKLKLNLDPHGPSFARLGDGQRPQSAQCAVSVQRAQSVQRTQSVQRLKYAQKDLVSLTVDDLATLFRGCDAVCHLAFVLDATVSDRRAQEIDIDATRKVFWAAQKAAVPKLVVSSSVSAYGAALHNPKRLTENHPLRAAFQGFGPRIVPDYRYGHHKATVEHMLFRLANDRTNTARDFPLQVVSLRISIILGPPPRPGAATRVLAAPVLCFPARFRVQFIHVTDVARAIWMSVRGPGPRFDSSSYQHRCTALSPRTPTLSSDPPCRLRRRPLLPFAYRAYNLAAEPPLSGRDLARILQKPYLAVPDCVLGACSRLARVGRLADPGRLDLLRFPILVDTHRIQRELGFVPTVPGDDCLRALQPTITPH